MTAERNKQSASHNGSDGSSSGCPHIRYTPSPGTTSDVEAQALVAVYKFVLERYDQGKKGAGTEIGREDGEEVAERSRIGGIVSEERP